jgi:hypothetical protein
MNWTAKFSSRGLVLAAVQIVLVVSVAAKFSMDRARLPRIWVKTQSIDPYLPIRGRYIAMRLTVNVDSVGAGLGRKPYRSFFHARIFDKDGRLAAEERPNDESEDVWVDESRQGGEFTLQQPILFFLPEHAPDLMSLARNGELWAEVTVPESGLPRPIRLGIKRGGSFEPIEAK